MNIKTTDLSRKAIAPDEIISFLNNIEKTIPVNKWVIQDIKIWPIVRIEIATKLRTLNFAGEIVKVPRKVIAREELKNIFKSDKKHNSRIKFSPDIILIGVSTGKTKIGNSYYNQYISPLQEWLKDNGFTTILLEREKKGQIQLPRFNDSVIVSYQQWEWLLTKFRKLALRRIKDIFLPGLLDVVTQVQLYIQDVSFLTKERIIEWTSKIISFKTFYTIIFKLLNPKTVIVQCYYSLDSFAISLAARKLGIQCWDYQHGIQGAYHYAYAPWLNIPLSGYEMMPSGYLVWDNSSYKNLRSWCDGIAKVRLIGNFWHEKSKNISYMFEKDLIALKQQTIGKKIILFSAQNSTIQDWVLNAVNIIPDLFWCFRLHPMHLNVGNSIRQSLKDSKNYDMKISSDLPLPMILRLVDIHVTGSSSVVIEAASFGIRSIVIDSIGEIYYQSLISEGFVYVANNVDELKNNIEIILKEKKYSRILLGDDDRDTFINDLKLL